MPTRANIRTHEKGDVAVGKASGEWKFVQELPLDVIILEDRPLRTFMTDEGMEDLRASIREHGVLVPITVTKVTEGYRLVAGLRRVLICRALELATIPALVVVMSESEEVWARFAENIIREDLSALDEGLYLVEWMNRKGLTQVEVAAALGKSEAWVSQRVGIMRWPEDVRECLARRGISFGVALQLAGIEDGQRRRHCLRFAELGGCSVRQAAEWRRQVLRDAMREAGGPAVVPESEPEGEGGGVGDRCFVCEREIGLEGGQYLRVCQKCGDSIVEKMSRG